MIKHKALPYKISGCCSLCDEPAFEIISRWEPHEHRPGEPKRIGKPLEGSVRVTFLLYNGRRTDMSFCGECAERPDLAEWYATLWRKNLGGYMREQNGDPSKFKEEFANGLLCELSRTSWKELAANGR
jgi:hypothetical protein